MNDLYRPCRVYHIIFDLKKERLKLILSNVARKQLYSDDTFAVKCTFPVINCTRCTFPEKKMKTGRKCVYFRTNHLFHALFFREIETGPNYFSIKTKQVLLTSLFSGTKRQGFIPIHGRNVPQFNCHVFKKFLALNESQFTAGAGAAAKPAAWMTISKTYSRSDGASSTRCRWEDASFQLD